MTKLILRAMDLDSYLNKEDKDSIKLLTDKYNDALEIFNRYSTTKKKTSKEACFQEMVKIYSEMGKIMKNNLDREKNIHVYSLETPSFIHGEVSRLIAKLRDGNTQSPEFVYYIQRAYELLFNLAFGGEPDSKHNIVVKTPVSFPVDNYAIHNIPNIDQKTGNSVMIVMLRAALLPSMIVSKEIQEYSSNNYVTPFALFKIGRDDTKKEMNMSYILDLEKSYFNLDYLDGKDWFFADPMNATGGSMITVVKFLLDQGITPKSIKFFNVISVMKGSYRIIRAIDNAEIYTLWMDPALNEKAYIMPGIGDAGDRINGPDNPKYPRDILQLMADYGSRITSLYRSQLRSIEKTVLSNN
ncbi:MAG: uracil phosphoribosyltransferase [Deltaproteobacteria bacterium]|jgi:uracil phosphoribosyltransferase|nr:uracil phosphoribosyltransferase [Deltaproteobacteria bacterium]